MSKQSKDQKVKDKKVKERGAPTPSVVKEYQVFYLEPQEKNKAGKPCQGKWVAQESVKSKGRKSLMYELRNQERPFKVRLLTNAA